jgi:hypothetical protein
MTGEHETPETPKVNPPDFVTMQKSAQGKAAMPAEKKPEPETGKADATEDPF